METTTQPHRQMLRRICTLGRVAGWAMIVMGVLRVGVLAFEGWITAPLNVGRTQPALFGMQWFLGQSVVAVDHILTGLVVLGMVQFIRYVVEEGAEPRWLLRNGHIILCLFALSLLLTWGLRDWPQMWNVLEPVLTRPPEQMIPMSLPLGVALTVLVALLPTITKALCVLGIAATLRTVLPIMAESKTLA